MESWLFQANPKFYRVRPALHHFKGTSQLTTWLVNAHKTQIKADDEVFFWEAGSQAGLVGWGRIQMEPAKIPLEQEEWQFVILKAKFDGLRIRVPISVQGECFRSRAELSKMPAFTHWAPIKRGVQGTNFRIPSELVEQLRICCG